MSTDQVIDPFSPHSLMSIGLAALRSVLMAATLASGGAYLAWQGVMTPTFTKGLSSVSMQLTIPALLFSTVLPSVDFRLITSAWPLLLMPAVYVLVGCAIGVVVVAVCQPPADFRRGTIAAIAFGNSTGMPIVLLSVITQELQNWWVTLKHVDVQHAGEYATMPLVYLSVYLITNPIMQWGVGYWLLTSSLKDGGGVARRKTPDQLVAVADGEKTAVVMPDDSPAPVRHRAAAAAASSGVRAPELVEPLLLDAPDAEALARRLPAVPAVLPSTTAPRISFSPADVWHARLRSVRKATTAVWVTLRQRVLKPPVIAVLTGLLCSSLSPTYWLLCGGEYGKRVPEKLCPESNALLGWLTRGLKALGASATPINLILLGSALSKGPDWNALPIKVNVGIVLGKMVLLPCAAIAITMWMAKAIGADGLGWISLPHPWDETFYMTVLAVSATPSANQLLVMTEQAGGNRAAMATAVFSQYAVAPFILTFVLTAFVLITVQL